MSAFVCILDRSGAAVDPAELRRLAERLAEYGPELDTLCRGPVGIAVRHRGGPGASWRLGPLEDDPAFTAVLSGSFALVAADPGAGRLRLARDRLGDLKVYYFLDPRWLVAASEPAAVLAHGAVPDDLDEVSAARFLGFRFGHTERSFFRAVRELPPAHRLEVTAGEASTERYWRFRRRRPARGLPPEEVAGEFRRLLGEAVAAETAGLRPEEVALSLGGGLDSTAIAALAPPGVRAFSWTFEHSDEAPLVEAVSRHLDLPVRRVPGDGLHPLCDGFEERFVHPGSPHVNAFSALKCRLYEAAREAGCRRVLVGDGGDALYAAREYWLRDALAAGRPWALRSLAGTLRRAARGDRFARLSLVRVLPVRGLRTALRRDPIPWLTPEARTALPPAAPSPVLPPGRRRRARWELAVGAKHAELESEERRLFARCGVERGNPYWSWPLLEWAVQLPAWWYHRDDRTKVLTREALRGRLPERVLESPRVGLLGDFFLRGIELRREDLRDRVFRRPVSDWRRYVRPEWVEPYLSDTRAIAFGHTILWRVIGYELWVRRLVRGG